MAKELAADAPAEALGRRRVIGLRMWIYLAVLALFVAVAVLAPLVASQGYNHQNLLATLLPPSWQHPFGTDAFGRSEFARIVWGSRISLEVGFVAVLAGASFGTALGIIGGLAGGAVDTALTALADIVWSFPTVLLAIGLVAILRPGEVSAIVAVAIGTWPQYARVVRSSVLELRERPFVEAARAIGASPSRVALVHILPNVLGQVLVLASVGVAQAILVEATLSYLGLGAQPPLPDWGGMLTSAQQYIFQAPWLSIAPGVALTAVVVVLNEIGELLADIYAPKRRSMIGS